MDSISLVEHIRKFTSLSDAEANELQGRVERRVLGRRKELWREGGDAQWLIFVETGLLRLYSIDEAKEITHQFALQGWWLTDWEGFERGGPTKFHLQAVEESQIVLIPREGYEPLLEALPTLERYFRRIFQRAYGAAQRRLQINETSGAEDMYWGFVKLYPEFVQRVPQYMLASFLGFTPEFLSRLRAQR